MSGKQPRPFSFFLWQAIVLGFGVTNFLCGQTTALNFRPVAAEYSLALDRIIMVSSAPNQLHIYDPSANADVTVTLANPPLDLSVSPDGLHAAVTYSASVDYVNLQSGAIERNYLVTVSGGDYYNTPAKVVLGSDYLYVVPGYVGSTSSINLLSGAVTTTTFNYGSGGRYNSTTKAIYSLQNGLSPNDLLRYDVSAGPIAGVTDSVYHGDFLMCGNVWFSPDESRIYTGCGTVFRASTDTAKDRHYVSALSGLSTMQAFSESATIHRIAAVPWATDYLYNSSSLNEGEVRLFDSDYLNQVGRFSLQPFYVGSNLYAAHGRYVFFNNAGTFLYVLNQADTSSGLLKDFAIQRISLATPSSCSVTLDKATLTVSGAGATGSVNITAPADCIFQAQSDSSWIKLVSNYYGSGNTQLTFIVRPNLTTASRTGNISIGTRIFTLMQDAATTMPVLNPLSYKVAAADYSKSLDRMVLASGTSNELHLYDAISGADQSIDLPAPPLFLSVRPDGEYAAVGHNGWVSYVNLQSQAVEQVIPIDADRYSLVLAGNGYLYAFPSDTWIAPLYYLHIGDTSWTTASNTFFASGQARLHESGKYIYVGLLKLDITAGIPKSVGTGVFGSTCNVSNIWLTEDGQRLITPCGSVYRTTESVDDLSANGSLSGNSGVTWAAHSIQQHQIAIINSYSAGLYQSDNTKLQIYGDDALQFIGQNTLPQFAVGSASVVGHGRFVFWNAAESKMFVVEQADSISGLLSDYGVYTLNAGSGPAACSYQLSATQFSVGASGRTGNSIGVTTQPGCGWTAITSSSLLYISSGSSGTGPGTVQFNVYSNYSTKTQSGTLTIAGQTVSVSQDGLAPCSNTSLYPSYATVLPVGGSGTFTISTDSQCAWTAVSNNPSWLTVVSNISGYGNAIITYSAAPNLDTTSRTGTILAGGKTLTVTQTGTVLTVAPGLRLVPLIPCRVLDTRLAQGDFGGPFLAGQTSRDFVLPSGNCGIPATALGYSLNVTVVPHGPLRYLTIWPTGGARPTVSTLNSYDARIRANAAIIPAGPSGKISVFVTDDTEVILDINGYFVQDSTALAYYPVTPCRVADTRLGLADLGGPGLMGGQNRTFPVRASSCNIPAEAQAYSLNYTAVPKKPLGYLTTWPTGQTRPLVSTLNAPTGVVTANAAIVPAGTNGSVDVYASDDTDLIVDITGYFAPPGFGGLSLYTVAPCRAFDSRITGSGQPFLGILDINVQASGCSLPAGAQAYAMNATVVPSAQLSYLTLWPSGTKQPVVSTLNSYDGAVTANMALTPAQGGLVSSYVTDMTHLILDVTGYFAP